MVKEARTVLYRNVEPVKVEEWSSKCSNWDLACTRSLKDLVMIVVEKVKSSMKLTNVRLVKERR